MTSDASQTQIPWHTLPIEESLARAESTMGGITEAEAQLRLSRHGPNVLQVTPPAAWWVILAGQLKSVFVVLLVIAASARPDHR